MNRIVINTAPENHKRLLSRLSLYALLAVVFALFAFSNRYHLLYLEQIQLFRYNTSYVADFFTIPGGFINLLEAFIVQFFHISWLGALIITLLCFLAFKLTSSVLKKSGINGILFSLLPVLILTALHSHHQYNLHFTLGYLLSLACYIWLAGIPRERNSLIAALLTFTLLYILAGIFAIFFLTLYLLHKLTCVSGLRRYVHIAGVLFFATAITYTAWRFVYLIPFEQFLPIPFHLLTIPRIKILLMVLILYYPLIMFMIPAWQRIFNRPFPDASWNVSTITTSLLLFIALAFMIGKHSYDRKSELFLRMDNQYQKADWNGVLETAEKYPGQNQLVMYLTNLALFQTGKLSDSMFDYPQSGTKGLWLTWERNETAPFFGGEVYYHLGYNNEAFRWAFEAMEVKGLNPRSLKRLIKTSMVNYDYAIASKYLNYLRQTLFYRKWANQYKAMVNDTSLISQDTELTKKRKLLLSNDFIAINNSHTIGLERLIDNHSDNRMAFEYLMASYLLKKELGSFSANLHRLENFGYEDIPVHYEEAILLYAGLTGNNPLPKGYTIRNTTREKYRNYARIFAANRHNMPKATDVLFKQYGNTFWFYMQFVNPNLNQVNQ
ncbi:MAG: hypothetical protein JW973_16375 [Bacteroidales bacterium]|nr:hypothetical protein [Bacteroidales bacterium]